MLNRITFDREYSNLFAVFGKSAPHDKRRDVVWEAVQETDDVFFCDACAKLKEGSSLPVNLVAEFTRAWDVWIAGRRAWRSEDIDACPEGCDHGWFLLYRTDAPMAPFAFKCRCNTDQRFADQRAYTRAELELRPELSFEDPFATRASRDAWLAKQAQKAQKPAQTVPPQLRQEASGFLRRMP